MDDEADWRFIMNRCSTCVVLHDDGSKEVYAKAPLMRKFKANTIAELRAMIEAAEATPKEKTDG